MLADTRARKAIDEDCSYSTTRNVDCVLIWGDQRIILHKFVAAAVPGAQSNACGEDMTIRALICNFGPRMLEIHDAIVRQS